MPERSPSEREQAARERAERRAGRDAGAGGAATSAPRRRERAPRSGGADGGGGPGGSRRGLLLAGGLVVSLALAATGFATLGGGSENGTRVDGSATTADAETAAAKPPELPGGGRRIFPERRVVAYYGNPQDRELGELGVGSINGMLKRLTKQAEPYARKTRPVLPALELITTVAAAHPGDDGDYAIRTPASVIDRFLRAARRIDALLLLDIQPGRASFPKEVRRLAKWLKEPDVGLALDPEWRMQAGQVPGSVIGSVDASEVDQVSASLARVVKEENLPEKLFVIHQFTDDMVRGSVAKRPGLATVFNVDGFGGPTIKKAKYRSLTAGKAGYRHGYKLFYKEDTDLMKPRSVMALQPRPDLIVYE